MTEGELRERLAQLMCTFEYKAERMSLAEIVGDVRSDEIDTRRPRVDMILAEITAAGYVLVPADRYERLRQLAEYAHRGDTRSWIRRGHRPTVSLAPGDLEPLEGAERLDDGGEA